MNRNRCAARLAAMAVFGLIAGPGLASPNADPGNLAQSIPVRSELQQVAFQRVGCGLREMMWRDIYVLSLYNGVYDGSFDGAYDGVETARMLRMDVVYDGDMPPGIPDDWRPSLSKVVSQAEIDTIDAAFSKLAKGDVVQFTYIPKTDESYVLVNREVRLGTVGNGLYETIQAMWLGDKPISDKIKRNIEQRVCDV